VTQNATEQTVQNIDIWRQGNVCEILGIWRVRHVRGPRGGLIVSLFWWLSPNISPTISDNTLTIDDTKTKKSIRLQLSVFQRTMAASLASATTAVSSLAPLSEQFKAEVSLVDSGFDASSQDIADIREFEFAWSDFLTKYPEQTPKGQRENRIETLQKQIRETELSKTSMEEELQTQLDFFRTKCEQLEDTMTAERTVAKASHHATYDALCRQLDAVARADHLQHQTLPWLHFLHEVDRIAAKKISAEFATRDSIDDGPKNKARPSARALALTSTCATMDSGLSSDLELRSYRIDHAILSTHVSVLRKEIERYEKTMESQQWAGQFLTEHNVWGILTATKSASTASVTTAGTKSFSSPQRAVASYGRSANDSTSSAVETKIAPSHEEMPFTPNHMPQLSELPLGKSKSTTNA
jgi:hypothetical protein